MKEKEGIELQIQIEEALGFKSDAGPFRTSTVVIIYPVEFYLVRNTDEVETVEQDMIPKRYATR